MKTTAETLATMTTPVTIVKHTFIRVCIYSVMILLRCSSTHSRVVAASHFRVGPYPYLSGVVLYADPEKMMLVAIVDQEMTQGFSKRRGEWESGIQLYYVTHLSSPAYLHKL